MEPYFEEIPLRVRHVIKGLGSEIRQAILVCLLREETPPVFGELMGKFPLSRTKLRAELRVLLRYGLVDSFYTANSFDPKHLHYDLSKAGRVIVTALIAGSWLQSEL